jgi:cytochrome c-type biogenesis protein CcmH/NrfF
MTLATCPSPAAGDLRREIAARASAGETASEIKESLVYRFGDALRAEPEPRGAGLALWVVPALLGAGILAFLVAGSGLRRGRSRRPARAPVEIDPALSARLDDELQRLG